MKKYKFYFLGLAAFVVLIAGGVGWSMIRHYPNWNARDDFKIAYLADDGMKLVSVSRERKMINQAIVNSSIKVWVPQGYGWYIADRVKKLLETEKKMDLSGDLFFYNFGYVPDKVIIVDNLAESQNEWVLLTNIGLMNYLKYHWYEPGLMEKTDEIDKDLQNNAEVGDLMQLSFADSKLLGEEVRISLINSSGANGLAGWLSARMEWEGMTVVGLETRDSLDGICALQMGKSVAETETYKSIARKFDCVETVDERMGDLEVELNLGKEFPKVIKY